MLSTHALLTERNDETDDGTNDEPDKRMSMVERKSPKSGALFYEGFLRRQELRRVLQEGIPEKECCISEFIEDLSGMR